MKNKFILGIAAVGLLSLGAVTGCKKKTNSSEVDFSFSIGLESGYKRLRVGASSRIVVTADGNTSGRNYAYRSSDESVLKIENGVATGLKDGKATINAVESTSGKSASVNIVVSSATEANGGYNYAAATGAESIKTRTEILATLEKYAMDNHLTGITLFENGGYVKYHPRVKLPTNEYITGFGFGLLSDGELEYDMPADKEENPNYRGYLHSATSSDPLTINEKNDTGSQVSDLAGYITSSFWGTRLNSTKDNYEWYPVLARDKVTLAGQQYDNNRPFPVYNGEVVNPNEDPNPLKLYDTYRIYLRDGVRYNTTATIAGRAAFNDAEVQLEDYEFAFRFLLTGSHKQKRGTEMANDTSYGIKGAQKYNTESKDKDDTYNKNLWDTMVNNGSLGVKVDTDDAGQKYLQLTLVNPIDRFTAMYTLSSSLYSPLPEEFIRQCSYDPARNNALALGAQAYGNFNDESRYEGKGRNDIKQFTIAVGPYHLEDWKENQTIVFKKSTNWFESSSRYHIPGVKLVVMKAVQSDPDAIYKEFNAGKLDSCGIPSRHVSEELGQEGVKQTKGDSTFKLNVNSCTQETWNDLFGPNGKIYKNANWEVKPWMSNDNFLSGLFHSINRKVFADNRGVAPSINYFSDAYLSDAEGGKSYNETEAHKAAVADYETYDRDGNSTYGYDYDKAVLSFKAAVRELAAAGKIEKGTKSKPTTIKIHIRWMYQTDIKEYGEEIATYFEDAFNNEAVSGGTVKLKVEQEAVTNWQDVYNVYLMRGQFDLGFGAISGNTYNPLNFLEVLRSDNSSGFTLNWGTDTSKVTEGKPAEYDHKLWSYDSLWEVADHGGVVENGVAVKSVQESYLETPKNSGGQDTNELYNGFNVDSPLRFVDVGSSVAFGVSKVQLYVSGSGSYNLDYTYNDGKLHIVVPASQASEINTDIQKTNHLDQEESPSYDPHPFVLDNYGKYWTVEVYYTLSINGGTPSESYVTVAKNKDAQPKNVRYSLLGGR